MSAWLRLGVAVARETDHGGCEDQILWRLLTTLPVTTREQAEVVIDLLIGPPEIHQPDLRQIAFAL